MRRRTEILGVPFDVGTMHKAVEQAYSFFNDSGQHIICTPNPEIVMAAQEDVELLEILKAADLVVPDGIGVVWASKYSKFPLPERVAGFDLVQLLFDKLKDTEHTVYFFGGEPGVATLAAKKMAKEYPGLKIVGIRNGYFSHKDEKQIIDEIRRVSPSLLLVGLGAPKQEKWIYNNMRFTGAKVCIGVGGSFDAMAGQVKRAPRLFRKLGLEWFYRLLKQPSRIGRMMKLPVFVFKVLKNRTLRK